MRTMVFGSIKDRFESPAAAAVLASLAAFLVSFLLRSYDYNGNLTQMAVSVRAGILDVNPSHLLFQPSLFLAKAFAGKNADIFTAAQFLTAAYAAVTTVGVYLLILELTGRKGLALLASLVFSFSYSIWWYGAMGYPVLLGFMLVPAYFALALRAALRPVWGAFAALAALNVLLMAAYVSNLFAIAAVFAFLMVALPGRIPRIKAAACFAASAAAVAVTFYLFFLADGQRPPGISFAGWLTSYGGGAIFLDFGGFGNAANYFRFAFQLPNVFWNLMDLGKIVKHFLSTRDAGILSFANILTVGAMALFYLLLGWAAVLGAGRLRRVDRRAKIFCSTMAGYAVANVLFNFYWVIDTQIMIPVVFSAFLLAIVSLHVADFGKRLVFLAGLLAFTAAWNFATGIFPDHRNKSGLDNVRELMARTENGALIITPGGDWVRSFGVFFLRERELLTLYHMVASHPFDETKESYFQKLGASVDSALAQGRPVYLSGVHRPQTDLATSVRGESYVWGDISIRGYSRDDFIAFFDRYQRAKAFAVDGLEFQRIGGKRP